MPLSKTLGRALVLAALAALPASAAADHVIVLDPHGDNRLSFRAGAEGPAVAPSRTRLAGTEQAEAPEGAAAAMAGEWTRYENPRFGTVIDYPADLFLALPPPENGDGLSFKSVDDAARFIVFGQMNAFDQTVEEMMADDLASGAYGQVTYQRKGTDWYVLSGYRGGNVYYRKVVVPAGGDTLHVFEIDYPPARKAAYDRITARMAKSLKAE
jgi:hypothetical protein